jgi:hypothetical protein
VLLIERKLGKTFSCLSWYTAACASPLSTFSLWVIIGVMSCLMKAPKGKCHDCCGKI